MIQLTCANRVQLSNMNVEKEGEAVLALEGLFLLASYLTEVKYCEF